MNHDEFHSDDFRPFAKLTSCEIKWIPTKWCGLCGFSHIWCRLAEFDSDARHLSPCDSLFVRRPFWMCCTVMCLGGFQTDSVYHIKLHTHQLTATCCILSIGSCSEFLRTHRPQQIAKRRRNPQKCNKDSKKQESPVLSFSLCGHQFPNAGQFRCSQLKGNQRMKGSSFAKSTIHSGPLCD